MVLSPTRTVNGSSNILDLFLCDNIDIVKSVDVIPGISDHDAVLAILNVPNHVAKEQSKVIYDFKRARWDDLKALFNLRLPSHFDQMDINEAWET
jgi:hypothetical protein